MNGFGFGSNSEMTYASDVLQTGLPRFRVIFLSGMSKAKLKKKGESVDYFFVIQPQAQRT